MVIEVLVGMIGSGKSLYAKIRADQSALVICHDDLTAMLHVRYCYEQKLRELYRRMEESIAFSALSAGRDVIVDRTHLTRESRRRWILWANNYICLNTFDDKGPKVDIVAVRFPIFPAHVHATRRFESDPRGRTFLEWHQIALHHADQAKSEPLEMSEGFDEIVDMPPDWGAK